MAGGTRKGWGLPWEAVFLSLFISAVSPLSISPSLSLLPLALISNIHGPGLLVAMETQCAAGW